MNKPQRLPQAPVQAGRVRHTETMKAALEAAGLRLDPETADRFACEVERYYLAHAAVALKASYTVPDRPNRPDYMHAAQAAVRWSTTAKAEDMVTVTEEPAMFGGVRLDAELVVLKAGA